MPPIGLLAVLLSATGLLDGRPLRLGTTGAVGMTVPIVPTVPVEPKADVEFPAGYGADGTDEAEMGAETGELS